MKQQIYFDKNKVNLLSMCCTFRRPKMLQNMLDSFYKTKSEGSEIIIYLHEDDPFLNDYLPVVKDQNYILDVHRMLCKAMNHIAFNIYPKIPYYQTIVDDHIYKTVGWDNMLINALHEKTNDLGFVCPADGINNNDWYKYEHPSAEVYSWKFISTVGYIYPKDFDAFGSDLYMKDIAKAINALTHVPEVLIEHLWYAGCGKNPDINIQEGYSSKSQQHGLQVYNEWIKTERTQLIKKLLEIR